MKTRYQDILKIIMASSFKHGQCAEDDEKITWWKLKNKLFFGGLLPFANFVIQNL